MDDITKHGAEYASLAVRTLTSQEDAYVRYSIQGLNPSAALRAAGYKNPAQTLMEFAERDDIQTALAHGREMVRQTALAHGALEFSRDDATMMYLDAHSKAENATEMIRATDSLVKLHGLAEPEKKEVRVTNRHEIEALDSEELMKLAGSEIQLSPDDYTEVTESER